MPPPHITFYPGPTFTWKIPLLNKFFEAPPKALTRFRERVTRMQNLRYLDAESAYRICVTQIIMQNLRSRKWCEQPCKILRVQSLASASLFLENLAVLKSEILLNFQELVFYTTYGRRTAHVEWTSKFSSMCFHPNV
jgi:hypothetical protein